VPAAQSVHATFPVPEFAVNFPAAHTMQVATEVAEAVAENEPRPQSTQAEFPVPAVVVYLPLGHARQMLSPDKPL